MAYSKKYVERLEADLKAARKRLFELEPKGFSDGPRLSVAKSDDIVCGIPDLLWVKDGKGVYLRCNPAYEALLGLPQEEIIGKTDAMVTSKEWADVDKAYDRKVLDSGEPIVFEEGMTHANGERLFFEIMKTPVNDMGGNLIGILSVARDITERKLREDALVAEVRRSKMIMNISYDGIAIFNEDHRVVEANTRFIDMLGYSPEEVLALHSWDFDALLTEEEIRSGFKELSDPKNMIETQHRRKDGTVYDAEVSASGALFGDEFLVVTITRDISDRKEKEKLSRKVNQKNKMEAVGELAAGIAHDFNNILTGIAGAARLLGRYLPDHPKPQKVHKIILDTADRASSMVGSLMAFSRESPSSTAPVELHCIIHETINLLKVSIDKRITLKLYLEASYCFIIGDFSLLQNMLLNLCINSCHAMPDGGELAISTSIQELDNNYCSSTIFDITPGRYIELEVRDTGCGIPKYLLDKIFEPFFTTKEQGQGTGLGLSSVLGVVQQHKGAIFPYSEIGAGTVFQIFFPLSQDQEAPVFLPSVVPRGTGTILVVDDDEAMRDTAAAILSDLGYQVIMAQNGEEALHIYGRHGESIDLVLLDMMMPIMNGLECFEKLKGINYDVRVVFSSGFMMRDELPEINGKEKCRFIQKPYHVAKIEQVIYEVLNV